MMRILRLRDAGDEGQDGAVGMRRLAGHVDGQLAGDRVVRDHAAAGFDRGDVDARDVEILLDHDLRLVEDAVGLLLVSRLPMPDVVGLLLPVVANQWRIGLERLERIDD